MDLSVTRFPPNLYGIRAKPYTSLNRERCSHLKSPFMMYTQAQAQLLVASVLQLLFAAILNNSVAASEEVVNFMQNAQFVDLQRCISNALSPIGGLLDGFRNGFQNVESVVFLIYIYICFSNYCVCI